CDRFVLLIVLPCFPSTAWQCFLDFGACADKASILSLIREIIDNAIRIRNVDEIHLTSSFSEGYLHPMITNNGTSP
ncbi:MAG: hypothetical protein WCS90_00770, partial [Bacilli bacterium]